jgi:chromosome segregation ATPase
MMLLQSDAPFFTNDLAGFLKLAGVYASAVGIILGALVKLTFNAHTKRADEHTTQIAEARKGLETLRTEQATCSAKVGDIGSRMAVHEDRMSAVQREQGEHASAIHSFQSVQNNQQRDIMDAITALGRAISDDIKKVEIDVARLDERGKTADAIADLAAALRESGRHTNSN